MVPEFFSDEEQLDEFMTEPSAELVSMMAKLEGDIMILGIGGKMGHTLGRQAMRAVRRAGARKRIFGVSRFSDPAQREKIQEAGIETITCDLLEPSEVEKLSDAPNVVFMAGRKFGTGGNEHLTWAMNTIVPSLVARRFFRSRIVVFSTGCVYPLVRPERGGCNESDPVGPVGEYAMSCLGRERIFEHYSRIRGTKTAIVRLNYSIDMRYGVLHDIASSVFARGRVDISVPAFNVIWQGDATEQILRTFGVCSDPPFIINITGLEQTSTKEIAVNMAELMDREVSFTSEEGEKALLSDSSKAAALFGISRVPLATMVRWTAHWVENGGASVGKPTHFEVHDGEY